MEAEHINIVLNNQDYLNTFFTRSVWVSANVFGVAPEKVLDKSRKRELVEARYGVIGAWHHIFKKENGNGGTKDEGLITLKETGNMMGLNHTTIIHGRKQVKNFCESDPVFREKYYRVRADIIKELTFIEQSEQGMKREEQIHKNIANYIRYQYPKTKFNVDLSGVPLSKKQAGIAKSLRSESGYPDLFIYNGINGYVGLVIELKAENVTVYKKDGTLVANDHIRKQAAMLGFFRSQGWMAEFGVGFDHAKQIIDEYLGG